MTENLKQYEHKKLLLITMQLHTSILLKTKKKPRLSEKKKKLQENNCLGTFCALRAAGCFISRSNMVYFSALEAIEVCANVFYCLQCTAL